MLRQNHSLALHSYSWNILKFNFSKSLDINRKISDCLTGLGLTSWYIRLELEKYLNITGLGFVLWHIRVRLEKYLNYLGFELIWRHIGLGLNAWIKLLDLNWFYYNQTRKLLEKSENLLELPVKQLLIQSRLASLKQLLIQSRLASLTFLGQAMFGAVKNGMLMLFVPKLGIFVSSKCYSSLSLI